MCASISLHGTPATYSLPNTRTYGAPSAWARSMKRRASSSCAACLTGSMSCICADAPRQDTASSCAASWRRASAMWSGASSGTFVRSMFVRIPRSSIDANWCSAAKSRILGQGHVGQPSVENPSGSFFGACQGSSSATPVARNSRREVTVTLDQSRLARPRRRSLFPQYQSEATMKRRRFVKTASSAALGLIAPRAPLFTSGSPSERVVVCVMGLNGRGTVLAKTFAKTPHAEVASVCDVDAKVLAKAAATVNAKAIADFRRALDDKYIDALVIATPDHWHAPAAILAMAAGKHVYLEKPCGHNAREGELLVDAQRKTKRVVQMGTQRRSSPRAIEAVQAIRDGMIGRAYFARAWYANRRATIGRGKAAPVPANLDYELWQGPAPRTPYRDNMIHYNWHWFRRWGTGEICNNGTHEIDVARWALGVDHPVRVTSAGGRYHFDDDWELTDTQEAAFEFDGGRSIAWQGLSCNPYPVEGRGRGTMVHGTTGSMVLDQDGYVVYDMDNKIVKQNVAPPPSGTDSLALSGDDQLTAFHSANFVEGVRTGAPVSQPIEEGAKSVLLCHLGNIAQWTGRALRVDPATGRIQGDEAAMAFWQREYAPGWAPTV